MSSTSVTFAPRQVSALIEATSSSLGVPDSSVFISRDSALSANAAKMVLAGSSPSLSINLTPVAQLAPFVVDSLLSESATKPLAARQGKILDGKIAAVRTDYGSHEADFASQFQTMLS